MNNVPDLNIIFRSIRISQGLKQCHLASVIGVQKSTLSQFERGDPAISPKKLLTAAKILNLNKEYVLHKKGYPFKPYKKIMPLLLRDDYLSEDNALYHLIKFAGSLELYLLKPKIRSLNGDIKKNDPNWTYAIIAVDNYDNYFLFRQNNHKYFSDKSLRLILRYSKELISSNECKINIHNINISGILYNKIKIWIGIKRSDLDPVISGTYNYKVDELIEFYENIDADPENISTALKLYKNNKL